MIPNVKNTLQLKSSKFFIYFVFILVCPPEISKNFFCLQQLKEIKPITLYVFVIIPSLMGVIWGCLYM